MAGGAGKTATKWTLFEIPSDEGPILQLLVRRDLMTEAQFARVAEQAAALGAVRAPSPGGA